MKYIDEYRNKEKVLQLSRLIKKFSSKDIVLMEVCGGHTMAIQKFGIPSLLPKTVKLLSGPGCPVCVTSKKFIDQAIAYCRLSNIIIATFGDLIRVPGSTSTLEKEKANGHDIRIVYSGLDSLKIAKNNPDKKVIFLGIGFETTAPGSAALIQQAEIQNLKNFFLFSSHKIMSPAMEAIINENVKIDGYLAPGHVSAITGIKIYKNIPEKYNLGCVITGFEPTDILQAIYMLVIQHETNNQKVEIQYTRAVKPEGNAKAQKLLNKYFSFRDDWWRGLGVLKNSGLCLKEKYSVFDAEKQIKVDVEKTKEEKGCICGEILKGLKIPTECKLFDRACKPANPIGACMVSSEGACAAFYKYNKYD